MNIFSICEVFEIGVDVDPLSSCIIEFVSATVLQKTVQGVEDDGDNR